MTPVRQGTSEEGTRLADTHHGVSDETRARVREQYDDQIATVDTANRMNVIGRNPADRERMPYFGYSTSRSGRFAKLLG